MRYGRLFSTLAVAAAANPLAALNELRRRERIPRRDRREPHLVGELRRAHGAISSSTASAGTGTPRSPGGPATARPGAHAAVGAVLSNAPAWACETNWEDWPYHFAQLLAPKLSVSGYADGCIYTWPGYQRPEPAALETFTYPADGARGTTSPYLYVLGYGGGTTSATLSHASLTGPEGLIAPARHRQRDARRPRATLPPGGFLTPESPLAGRHALHRAGHLHVRHRRARAQALELHHRPRGRGPDALRRGRARPAPRPSRTCPPRARRKVSLTLYRTRAAGRQARITTRGLTIGRRARVTVRAARLRAAARARAR